MQKAQNKAPEAAPETGVFVRPYLSGLSFVRKLQLKLVPAWLEVCRGDNPNTRISPIARGDGEMGTIRTRG